MTTEVFIVKVNGSSHPHATYESAIAVWGQVALAADAGRSIQAELWRHVAYPWCPIFYQGLLDPVTHTLDPDHFWAVPGKAIGSRHCIAALDFP